MKYECKILNLISSFSSVLYVENSDRTYKNSSSFFIIWYFKIILITENIIGEYIFVVYTELLNSEDDWKPLPCVLLLFTIYPY
jgi:hypothetical protein